MAERHSKQIPCDKRGNPIVPSDVSWQKAVGRAAALIPLGAVLLPLGLVLYNFVQLPEDLNIFSISFGLIAAFGLLFVLFGAVILVLGLRARAKAPSAEETERRAKAEGERAYAKVTSVETKLRRTPEGSRRMVRAVRTATVLSYIGALCGVLLAYYLTSVGNFAVLTPLAMVVFLLLWLLPTLLIAGLVRYF